MLRKTARKPRGILVSAVESVVDTEFNRDIRPQEINNLMRRMNSMHLDLTFDIHQTNLSIAIAPRLLYSGGVVSGTSAIFIDVERMISLDAILVYKNLFPLTSGVLSK